MKEIKLTKGFTVKVDDEDFEYLSQFSWQVRIIRNKQKYASGGTFVNGKSKTILMHRLIMNAPFGLEIDHIDHDGLNNQKGNLRICTRAQNRANASSRGTSKYNGVHFSGKCIISQIKINGENKYLGVFRTEEDAARAYDAAAKELYGEFANLNF